MDSINTQKTICAQFCSEFLPPFPFEKTGVAIDTLDKLPLNALRHPAENGTSGWFIWGGESLSQEQGFFQPLHIQHLSERCPEIIPYLALAPGWRVLLAPNQTEVWYEEGLLDV